MHLRTLLFGQKEEGDCMDSKKRVFVVQSDVSLPCSSVTDNDVA